MIPQVAQILLNTGTPVKAVFDIDFLSEKDFVKLTVAAFGGDWVDFEETFNRVDSAVRDNLKPESEAHIREKIIECCSSDFSFSKLKSEINSIMKTNKTWNIVKKFGRQGIPAGDATAQFDELLEKLKNIGIYVIPKGTIENFCQEIGNHGPKFVTKVLSDTDIGDDKLSDLREFVKMVHVGNAGVGPNIASQH